MGNWKQMMHYPTFRYIDHSQIATFQSEPFTAMTSFAIDDVLTLSVSDQKSPPTIRLWVHSDTVVLGVPDTRLPYLDDAVKLLASHGNHVIVRNSGGLAVALDDGVLNMSFILPQAKQISINDCYELMFHFVQYMFRDLTNDMKAYEIVGSYCPGDYDLSIHGVKFAGISQRRIKDGAAIQIYIDVEGNSTPKATLIRAFYNLGHREQETSFHYPKVEHKKMGSLSSLLHKEITIEQVKARAQAAMVNLNVGLMTTNFTKGELQTYETRLKQMKKRNQRIVDILADKKV